MNVDQLNTCLRDELSSTETYRQALEKHRGAYGQQPAFQQLARMLQDHEDSAARLRRLVQQNGGQPSTDSGAWGTWSKTVMGAAKLFGDKAALKALKEGEESGCKDYRTLLDDTTIPPEVKREITELEARQQEHIRTLDALIDAA